MKITAQQGRGQKIHILVDGEYRLTVTRDFWASQNIRSGDEIDDAEFAREAVERLEEMGYVNDEHYAHTLAQELYERRGMGKKRIEQELRQRGISRETASECAEELDGDDVERIKNLLETKFAGKFSDEKGRRRTFNALTRLGYGYSDIRSAMRSVDEEYEDTDDQFSC